jgi:transposase InsO family protein
MCPARRSLMTKKVVLEYAEGTENAAAACREFGIPRSSFYRWRKRFLAGGVAALRRKPPVGRHWPNQASPATVEKLLELRREHALGPQRIAWYIERYHGTRISCSSVYRALVRKGVGRLPKKSCVRALHTRRSAKQVPGHHVQVDVKFLSMKTAAGGNVRRFQYTAIDDATRIRALKIYAQHNQSSAIDFIDYVIERFPFRVHTVRTDRGGEFQARFHWHVEDKGIQHVYIRARTPQLNDKVERSHRSDQEEFYQLLAYTDDVDLKAKLAAWEHFYNYNRPHAALNGRTPYEILKCLLGESHTCPTTADTLQSPRPTVLGCGGGRLLCDTQVALTRPSSPGAGHSASEVRQLERRQGVTPPTAAAASPPRRPAQCSLRARGGARSPSRH